MTTPEVSVAIPTKGRPAWCVEAVKSALAQQGVDLDVVVAVDGPDDEVVEKLAALGDARLRVSVGPAAGRSATRNRAARMSKAPLVALLDDDDLLMPGALAARRDALARHPEAVAVFGPVAPMTADGTPIDERRRKSGDRESCRDRLVEQLRGNSLVPSTTMLRRDAAERAGLFPEDLATGEDWVFFLRLSAQGPFVHLPQPTVRYRRHEGQVRWDPAMQESALDLWIAKYFDDPATPERARPYRRRLEARVLAWVARNYRRRGEQASADRCLRAAVAKDWRLLLHPRRLRRWIGATLRGVARPRESSLRGT